MTKTPSRAEGYRKRAAALNKGLKSRAKAGRRPLLKKQKALTDMADNEDWLDGKLKSKT